jgi:hypothetical protein
MRFSPDGLYYWDGVQWVSTISHDGRSRWDGTQWVPLPATGYVAPYVQAPPRQPTSWTRPLQYGVIAWYVWSCIYALATPFILGGTMSQVMNQSIQRQQQLNPYATPPPPGFVDAMSSIMTFGVWITVVVYIAIYITAIIGSLKRWSWVFYTVTVLLGLTALLLPVYLFDAALMPSFSAYSGVNMPTWIYWVATIGGLPAVGLFVWMLVAWIRRGPWAMTRPGY